MRLTGYIMIEENGCYKTHLWIKDGLNDEYVHGLKESYRTYKEMRKHVMELTGADIGNKSKLKFDTTLIHKRPFANVEGRIDVV